tara:strand:- start:1218 stop:2018 length:801 start_codon:yes stop_codon:yes gene_type:complete
MSSGNHRLYIYDDPVDLVVTSDALYLDNRPMNNRKLKAHKGFSNELTFNIRDRDRKLQNVFSDTLYAHIYNPTTKKRMLSRKVEKTSSVGIIKLFLNEGDLTNIDAGLYKMYFTKDSAETKDMPLYSNQDYDVVMNIEILADGVIEPTPTQVANVFTQVANTSLGDSANIFTTNSLYGNQDRNFSDARHSLAIYPSTYTGNIVIQGSIVESQPGNDDASKDWFNIANCSFSATSNLTHKSFTINANWIRCLSYPASGSISQILLRN